MHQNFEDPLPIGTQVPCSDIDPTAYLIIVGVVRRLHSGEWVYRARGRQGYTTVFSFV